MEFIKVYQCIDNGPFILAPEEIDDGNWFSFKEITERVAENDARLTDSFKTLWRQFETCNSGLLTE